MSIDFDSAALQTQHDEEEYDQEDYAREQEVCGKKLLLYSVFPMLREQICLSTVISDCYLFVIHLKDLIPLHVYTSG